MSTVPEVIVARHMNMECFLRDVGYHEQHGQRGTYQNEPRRSTGRGQPRSTSHGGAIFKEIISKL